MRCDEMARAHWSGVRATTRRERVLATAFFNTPSSCACCRLAARNWRNPVAVARSGSAARGCRHGGKGFLLPLAEAFGVDIQGACSGLGRAAFPGQA